MLLNNFVLTKWVIQSTFSTIEYKTTTLNKYPEMEVLFLICEYLGVSLSGISLSTELKSLNHYNIARVDEYKDNIS